MVSGMTVYRPRYVLPPKVGGYFHPQLIDLAIAKQVDQIRQAYPFDLIDAHWVYPAGAWSAKLAKRYGVPVVMTGRGEDMIKFPDLPLIGNQIRRALKFATGCIGVSQEISEQMIANGAAMERTCTIANGIDGQKFHPKIRSTCRQDCGLPVDVPIAISVGDRLELKGFHLVAEAMSLVRKRFPEALYIIVGGPGRFGRDYTSEIQSRIDQFALGANVRMVGPKPHGDLIDWYNAADLYVMMSSREGSPNVVLESLACGTPVIGNAVGGVQDELSDCLAGRLIHDRTPEAVAEAMIAEFESPRNPDVVAGLMKDRTWQATADRVSHFMHEVVDSSAAEFSSNPLHTIN
ncbi:glycosyltransferase [Stieleria tagensis]|uniref:glycosyltransferase n=1 Tax=Stieleria tagensis TaxID=2956795 RepID=UPI0036F1E7C5